MKLKNIMFENREDAFNSLHKILPINEMMQEEWIVLATSAGAVPIAILMAKKLKAKFDFLFTKKIFAFKNNECEVAIVTETQEVIIHEELMRSFSLNLEEIYKEANNIYNGEIKEYKAKYRNSLDILGLVDKNILLIDEGLNTGLTMMACIKSVISEKARSICVAVPILPEVTVTDIETIADDLYYVEAPAHFLSIDFYYKNLEEIELDDIQKLKDKYKKENDVNNM